MKKINAGFTLIEILVALVILAIIGGLMVVGLQSAIRSQNRITVHADRLAVVQSAIAVLERDIQQIINRPIIDENNTIRSAVVLTKQDNSQTLEFTRAGLINPFGMMNRSTLQRVTYSTDGKNLLRTTWPVLDRTSNTPSQTDILLPGISQFAVTLYYALQENNQQNSADQAPKLVTKDSTPSTQNQMANSEVQSIPMPVAVAIALQVDGIGIITRIIPLAG